VSQVPLPTVFAAACANWTLDQLLVDLWQVSHTVAPVWVLVFGLAVKPKVEVAWHVAQPVATATLLWKRAGNQLV